ncbi:uncharacterized protein BT62DRAFT_1008281 [Guyanagaster necrorhizus]|uniref:Uncharacterized protein n=1 Tax=Guyanagaster necrorhizus TaxID=856835 RepID=A0A9P7VMS6_9AGAR|nr:uncharacterized protein BT62DRAFT_1008281 [Guyanagaster necrorhizus MCA 3950]KAG7444076.1 hypothetical protein BT62DRAFT_1008281 [Guyanagaster necrorhizus MCA 3950]
MSLMVRIFSACSWFHLELDVGLPLGMRELRDITASRLGERESSSTVWRTTIQVKKSHTLFTITVIVTILFHARPHAVSPSPIVGGDDESIPAPGVQSPANGNTLAAPAAADVGHISSVLKLVMYGINASTLCFGNHDRHGIGWAAAGCLKHNTVEKKRLKELPPVFRPRCSGVAACELVVSNLPRVMSRFFHPTAISTLTSKEKNRARDGRRRWKTLRNDYKDECRTKDETNLYHPHNGLCNRAIKDDSPSGPEIGFYRQDSQPVKGSNADLKPDANSSQNNIEDIKTAGPKNSTGWPQLLQWLEFKLSVTTLDNGQYATGVLTADKDSMGNPSRQKVYMLPRDPEGVGVVAGQKRKLSSAGFRTHSIGALIGGYSSSKAFL